MGKIIDSDMSFAEAIAGIDMPEHIARSLTLLSVDYVGYDGKDHSGQIIVARPLAEEVREIFSRLFADGFPIEKMIPVCRYGWSDEKSMDDNNTSSFNYREIYGTNRLSLHSYGCAIDINPRTNPYHAPDGRVFPAGARFDPRAKGAVTERVVSLFAEYGWEWGGVWEHPDYQHFQKPAAAPTGER